MSHTVVRASSRRKVTLGALLGQGGEGEVFVADGGLEVAKVYWPGRRSSELRRKLEVMVAHPPRDPMRGSGSRSLAWPTDLLLDRGGSLVGFLMPYLDTRRCRPLHQVYYPPEYPAGIDWRMLVQTARNLAAALEALHRESYVAGDLNESNVLVATNTIVTFVDCDSMQVPDPGQGLVYRCIVGKPEYTPPELHGRDFSQIDRTPASDRFALAVLVCQVLVRGRHPFSGRPPNSIADNILAGHTIFANGFATAPGRMPAPGFMPPEVRSLFERAFVAGIHSPSRRPSAREWQEELDRLLARILTCSRESSHKYSGHLSSCPWCAFEKAHGFSAFPKRRRPRKSSVVARQTRAGARAAPAPRGRQAPAFQPRIPPGGTWSWPGPVARRTASTLGQWLQGQVRRAAVGGVLGLLLVVGFLMSLPFLVGDASGPPTSQSAPQSSRRSALPPIPSPAPGNAVGVEQLPVEDVLRLSASARSEPEVWGRLAESLRDQGQGQLAMGASALADLLSSEITSAVEWGRGSDVLSLLRAVKIEDDEWLGDEGDRAARQGRRESSQALYYLAHALESDDREWLRKIEPRRGLRVRRGIDWGAEYGNQDGGIGRPGRVTAVPPETRAGWVAVEWRETSGANWYRWGEGDKYDLALAVPWSGSEV